MGAISNCPDIHARGAALLGEFAAGCALGMRNTVETFPQSPLALDPPPSIATALDRTQALIMVLDGAGKVLMFNRACEQLTGIAAEAIVGNYLWDYGLIPDDAHDYIPDLTQGVLDRLPKRYVNVWPESALGARRIAWDIHLVAGSDTQTRTIVCTGTDTTEPWLAQQALRDVRRRLTAHQDAAFVRLAQELHDGPLQELYQVQLTLLGDDRHTALPEVHQVIDAVIGALRDWCAELRPPALQSLGLTAAIESHLHDLQLAHPQLQMHTTLQDDRLVLAEAVRLQLYRIYQAACINILRHAQAQTISVRFAWDAEAVILEIADDGIGFTPPANWADLAAQGHYGLLNMIERADSCNGTLTITTAPGSGTLVRATLPGVLIDEAETL
jgi:PAS domain S-box-containing protein